MPDKFAETSRRSFNPMSSPALPEEARRAVNAAFDAMSAWRAETISSSEKNSEQVIEKMAAAARALGWPEQVVEATRAQMQSITKMQIQTMDHMMDAWEEQIKSPNPSAMLSKLKTMPDLGPAGSWANNVFQTGSMFQNGALNPFQAYAQFAEQWQKAWTDAMSFWSKAGQRR
jgi:hypothetical protein